MFDRSLSRMGHDARETAGDVLRDVGREAGRRGESAKGELSRLWSRIEDLVERQTPTRSEAADFAGEYAVRGRDMAYDLADQVRDATRARPLLALGVAVGASLLIMAMLTPRKR